MKLVGRVFDHAMKKQLPLSHDAMWTSDTLLCCASSVIRIADMTGDDIYVSCLPRREKGMR